MIRKHISKFIVLIFILSLILIMYYGVFGQGSERKSPLINSPAPDFELSTFDGGYVSLSELKGDIIVLNFWASWCLPCRTEARILESASHRYRDIPVHIVGVNIWDEERSARDFINRYNMSFINGYDKNNRIQLDYGVGGVPETFFINSNGIIVEKFSGELTHNILDYFLGQTIENTDHQDI